MLSHTKKADYKFPGLWFHGFRLIQFLASSTVAGVMFFFIHHLQDNSIPIPWMYFFLQGAALLTLLWLAVSTVLCCFHKLSPIHNSIVNGFTGIIWIVALGLLTNRMRWVIVRQCTIAMWADVKGVLICRLYKLLFSTAVIGCVATIGVFCTDITTIHGRDGRGKYMRTGKSNEPKKALDDETEYLSPGGSHLFGRNEDGVPLTATRYRPTDGSVLHRPPPAGQSL